MCETEKDSKQSRRKVDKLCEIGNKRLNWVPFITCERQINVVFVWCFSVYAILRTLFFG